jgi:hypothetical protein
MHNKRMKPLPDPIPTCPKHGRMVETMRAERGTHFACATPGCLARGWVPRPGNGKLTQKESKP